MSIVVTGSRIAVVDDDPVFRMSVVTVLQRAGYLVEPYTSAVEYLERRPAEPPSCLVLDLDLPGLSGLELQELLGGVGSDPPIVFVSGHAEVPTSVRAMRQGAVDFLQKPFVREDLLAAVERATRQGEALRSARLERQRAAEAVARLSPRERRVCELAAQGLTNREIATLLETNENTVKSLRKRGMERLGVESLPELVRLIDRLAPPPGRTG